MASFMKKYEAAVRIAIEETINVAEKLAVYLNPAAKTQAEAMYCLKRVCQADSYNALLLHRFLLTFGEVEIPKGPSKTTTHLNKELASPLGEELISIAAQGEAIK